MQGLHDFIIELKKPLNDTFTTENGNEFYAHKDFSVDRLSNRIAKVVSTPLFYKTPIEAGYEVMIEPTILYKQIFQKQKQDYTAFVDKKKMHFRVTPNMIVLYRKSKDKPWQGHGENILVQPIEETELPVTSDILIIPKTVKESRYKKDRVIMLYANKDIEDYGAKPGDEVIINPKGGIKFWLEGKEHWWLKNRHVWGVAG